MCSLSAGMPLTDYQQVGDYICLILCPLSIYYLFCWFPGKLLCISPYLSLPLIFVQGHPLLLTRAPFLYHEYLHVP